MKRFDTAIPPAGNAGACSAAERRTLVAVLAVGAVLSAPAWGAEMPDLQRGRLLYENHCVVCHTQKVHRRVPPLPIDLKELRQIVAAWAKGQKLGWSEQEITDVTEYLDSTHYRYLR